MRTTLDLSEDVFYAAKDYAKAQKMTMGEVISNWAREKFLPPAASVASTAGAASQQAPSAQAFAALGFATFPKREGAALLSNEAVNQLRAQEGI